MKDFKIAPKIPEPKEEIWEIEKLIMRIFRDRFFLPLLKTIQQDAKLIKNAQIDLHYALMTGRIAYSRGRFTGEFTASISKTLKGLGAKWDASQGSWRIPQEKLPKHIQASISQSKIDTKKKYDAFLSKLSEIKIDDITAQFSVAKQVDKILKKTQKQIQKNVQGLGVDIEISEFARAEIAANYTTNLDKYIKGFLEEQTKILRKKTQESVLEGNRLPELQKIIQDRYKVSASKAKFLARQETNLFVAAFEQSRYKEAGSTHYIWRCVKGTAEHPVRPMHKIHDGKIFAWDNPPIVDVNGGRAHPGESYNCRCSASPLLRLPKGYKAP